MNPISCSKSFGVRSSTTCLQPNWSMTVTAAFRNQIIVRVDIPFVLTFRTFDVRNALHKSFRSRGPSAASSRHRLVDSSRSSRMASTDRTPPWRLRSPAACSRLEPSCPPSREPTEQPRTGRDWPSRAADTSLRSGRCCGTERKAGVRFRWFADLAPLRLRWHF
jgi:hypothetical protein